MSSTVGLCHSISRIEDILTIIELTAIEFAFNLEMINFDEVLRSQGISEADFENYYNALSQFVSHTEFNYPNTTLKARAQHAHKLMTDSIVYRHEDQHKILNDCFGWVMPFSVLSVPIN